MAIRGIDHAFERVGVHSTLTLDGKPTLGTQRWLLGEAGRNGRTPLRNETEGLSSRDIGSKFPGLANSMDRSIFQATGKFGGVKNFTFASATRGNRQMPDGWNLNTGVFSTDLSVDLLTVISGGRSLKFSSAAAPINVSSDLIPIAGDGSTWLGMDFIRRYSSNLDSAFNIFIDQYDINKNLIVAGTAFIDTPLNSGWMTTRKPLQKVNSNARFASIRVTKQGSNSDSFVDSLNIYRVSREALATLSTLQLGIASFNPASPAYARINLDTVAYDYGDTLSTFTSILTIQESGQYDIEAQIDGGVTKNKFISVGGVIKVNGVIVATAPRVSTPEMTNVGGFDRAITKAYISRNFVAGNSITVEGGITGVSGSFINFGTASYMWCKMRSLD